MAQAPQQGWPDQYDQIAIAAGFPSWQQWIDQLEVQRGRSICGGKGRQALKPCERPPLAGRTRCRLHGGKTLIGAANPAYKHGEYSAAFPDGMLDDYLASLNDPEYMSLRKQIALSETREKELLRKLRGEGTSQLGLKFLRDRAADAATLIERIERWKEVPTEVKGLILLWREAMDILNNEQIRELVWKQLNDQLETTRLLRDSESKLKKDLDQRMDKDRALALMMWLVGLIKQRFGHEKGALVELSNEIRERLRRPNPVTLKSGVEVGTHAER